MEKVENYCIVYCNTESKENAELIATSLVNENLAACVSISSPIVSVYKWDDKIENRKEYTMMIKTIKSKLTLLENRILALHTDSVPEIISVGIDSISYKYLLWMKENIKND